MTIRSTIRPLLFILLLLGYHAMFAQRPSQEELELETMYIVATRAMLLGNNEEAIATYKMILEKDDTKDVVYYELAKVYLKIDANKEALDIIKKAVDLQPQNIWYQEELAAAYAANEDYTAAAEVYRDLIDQQPSEQKFYYDLAFHLVKNNDIKEAISVFNQHEKQFGVSEEVIGRKFNLYKTLGDQSKAEAELSKLVRAFPNELNYAIGLAKFYEDTNNLSKAKSTYQRILNSNPGNVEAQVALNNLNGGKSQESTETLWADASINIDIKISKIIPAINGLPKASAQKQEQIIAITKTITETHPNEAKAFAVHGDVLNFSGQPKKAVLAYENALSLEKNIFSVWDQLLNLYLELYDMNSLQAKSEMAIDYFPNESNVYYLNGLAANNQKSYTEALSSLTQADIMSKSDQRTNALVKIELARAYAGMNKPQKAIDILNGIALIEGPLPNLQAGMAFLESGETNKGNQLIQKAYKSNPSQWQVGYGMARLAYAQKDYKQAKMFLDKIVEAPDGAFHISELLGDILYQSGDIEGAVTQWKKSKSAGNADRNLTKKITSRQI